MAFKNPRILGHTVLDFLFTVTGSGQQEVIASVTGKTIRVLSYTLIVDGATTVTWKNATTAISGAMAFAINGGISVPKSSDRHAPCEHDPGRHEQECKDPRLSPAPTGVRRAQRFLTAFRG